MSNIQSLYLSSHALFTTLACVLFFVILLNSEDELQQYALNKALKISIVVTFLSLIGYGFYILLLGQSSVNIHVIFFGIDGISIITALLYYLELKGISFSIRKINEKSARILTSVSIVLIGIATISLLLRVVSRIITISLPDYLGNGKGIIRYDEILLYVNVILLAILTAVLPKIEKMSRDDYKKRMKKIDKTFNIVYLVCGLFWAVLIFYVIYQKVI